MVITQDPIGMSLPSRSSPSPPLGCNSLNTSIANPAQSPSEGINIFIPPEYNVTSSFVPTPVLSEIYALLIPTLNYQPGIHKLRGAGTRNAGLEPSLT
jgi:hypothetical protein